MKNKVYFLALNRIENIGPRTVIKLLQRFPDLEELFRLNCNQLQAMGVSERIAKAIKTFHFDALEQDFLWEEQRDQALLTWEDTSYPSLLKEIYDPPIILYAKGNMQSLQKSAVAIVGSRKPSITGGEIARRFAYELAGHQLTIVSGLALGIDAEAHHGCLEHGGSTIAVMATGIDRIYPGRHKILAEKLCQNGLLLTEFPLGTPPIPRHFPRRNRIISGLSLATLVVEAAIKSGSLITARLALEQNREVLAIPGSIHNPQARGCHALLQQGAKLVTSVEDILSELSVHVHYQPELMNSCIGHAEQHRLVEFIGFEPTSIDKIITRSGLNAANVTCDLTQLELQGVIKAVPGGYMRCPL